MDIIKYLFRTNGTYFGFIYEGNIFSRDGAYLGWIEGKYVWDADGNFRGELCEEKFILRNQLVIPASSRTPKLRPVMPPLPNPPPNIPPYSPPIGYTEAFVNI
ncbi:MAG: 4-fold beta flower protein [Candidatus Gracilibacteria bacterium]|jgi:hypothetical protein